MKTAFVIRDIPDLDHITPIIYKFLDKKKDFVILNYEINLNLQNDFRINFLQKKFGNVKIINLYSFIDKGILYSFLSKIFSIKNFEVNFKNLKNEKIYHLSFYKKLFFKTNILFSFSSSDLKSFIHITISLEYKYIFFSTSLNLSNIFSSFSL